MNNNYIESRVDKIYNQFYYVLVIEDENSRKTILLDEANYSIGRDSRNKIVLDSKKVSRFHATLLRRTSPSNRSFSYWLLDGDLQGNRSTNGIFINDKRCLVQELKHDDNIRLGLEIQMNYYMLDNMSDLALLQSGDFEHNPEYETTARLVSKNNSLSKDKSTTVIIEELNEPSEELTLNEEILEKPEMEKLASFPELTPNPVLEINWNGQITYLNPIANRLFPELKSYDANKNHPLLINLLENIQTNSKSRKFFSRKVKLKNKFFDQYIHYLHEQQLIRSYIFEQTEEYSFGGVSGASEAKYHYLLKQSKDGVLVADATSKKIIDVNPSLSHLLGYDVDELSNLTLYELINLEKEELDEQIHSLASSKTGNYLLKKLDYKCQNENLLELESSLGCLVLKNQTLISILVRPLSTKLAKETYIQSEGLYDFRTGLPNRQLLLEQLRLMVANSFRDKNLVSFLFIELELAEENGEALEHQIKAKILEGFAKRLKACLRSGDMIAYWESSQFACLLPQVRSSKDVGRICNRLLASLKRQLLLDNQKVDPKINIGISLKGDEDKTIDVLIAEAQQALIKSKELEYNHYQFFDEKLQFETERLLRLEHLLAIALEKEEFSLVYQPQIAVDENRITGIEAFIRWKHPELGIVNPGEFIFLAEETGLMISIGQWVMETACQQRKRWQEYQLTDQPICINISPVQFQHPKFVQLVQDILAKTELDPHLLELEIQESTIAMNMQLSEQCLTQLNQMGVKIAIDDFGTGVSSFGYLKQFNFSTVKIDRPIINDITTSSQDKALVSAVVNIAHSFHLRVVAEGVEEQIKVDELLELGCKQIQGNWLTTPLKEPKMTQFLLDSQHNF
jgi:diguanylate cyclase (GGDEF)-like protein